MASAAKAKTDIKVIILGDTNVGKTCLIQRYLTGEFADTVTSIGASLALRKWGDWNIALWDTAGEEKYASLSSFYCRGAHLALLAVDLTNKKTMDKLQEIFIPLLEQQAPNCMTVVVGTKLDLVKSEGRQIGTSEARSFAIMQHQKQLDRSLRENPGTFLNKVQGHESYFETSSKTGEGVTELFQYVERNMLIYLQKTVGAKPKTRPVSSEQTIRLDQAQQPPAAQSSGCCKGN